MSNESAIVYVNSRTEDLVIGFSYTFVALLQMAFYVPCLIVMRTDSELRSLSCLRMMFHLGLADMCNMVCQATAGILIMTRWAYSMPYWLNRLFGDIQTSASWWWYITTCHVIAFNRCVTICMPPIYKAKLFSEKATTCWLIVCFLHAFIWFVMALTPKYSFILIPQLFAFYFDESYPWAEQMKVVAWWSGNLITYMSGVWYLIIFIYLRIKSNSYMSDSEEQRNTRAKERKILYQAAIICTYTIAWNQYWHLAPYLYGNFNFKYTFYVGNMLWISNSAINPLVYLTLNKTIKRKVKVMILGPSATVHPAKSDGKRTTAKNRRNHVSHARNGLRNESKM